MDLGGFGKKFSDKGKMMFFSQLHMLIRSGLSFSRAFELLIDSAKPKDAELYSRVFAQVVSGRELWRALESERGFTRLDSSVVRIGEETGRLSDALEFLTDYYRSREEQIRMVKSALSYPVIILCIAIVVLIFMLLVVVPMFEQVYARMGGSLPAVTQWIIVFAESVPRFLVILCTAGALIYMIRVRYGKTDSYRSVVSGLWMRLPLAGGLVRKYQVARFSRILYLLVSSDVPILHSLHLMQGIVSFYPYRKSLDSVCMDVEKGCSLTEGLSRFEFLYGKRFIILIRVSEETNSLGEALRTQADELDRELKYDIGQMNNILEPVLIMVIGIVVAFVLIAMYMPMFKLGMTIN